MSKPVNPDNKSPKDIKPHSSFVSKTQALTPLFSLAAALICLSFTLFRPELLDSDGFLFIIGNLTGGAAGLAQSARGGQDDRYYY